MRPGPSIGLPQVALAVIDLSLAGAVVWWLLPADANIDFLTFLGAYAAAVIAGIISHVPGGIGVFETVMILLRCRTSQPEALLGSLLAYRAIYYLVPPFCSAAMLFGAKELSAASAPASHAPTSSRRLYIAPVVPQVASALAFLAGTVLLISGATPGIDERLAFLDRFLPLTVLEVSHLAGSLIGLGLLVLARALFRRVQAAYHIVLLAARRRHGRLAAEGAGLRGSDRSSPWCWGMGLGRRCLLPPDGDTLGAVHARCGSRASSASS